MDILLTKLDHTPHLPKVILLELLKYIDQPDTNIFRTTSRMLAGPPTCKPKSLLENANRPEIMEYLGQEDRNTLSKSSKKMLLDCFNEYNTEIIINNNTMAELFSKIPKHKARNVQKIEFHGDLYRTASNQHIRALTQCKNLKELNLHNKKITERGIALLMNQTNFPNLEYLDLSSCNLVTTLNVSTKLKKVYINNMEGLEQIQIRKDLEYVFFWDVDDDRLVSFTWKQNDSDNINNYHFAGIDPKEVTCNVEQQSNTITDMKTVLQEYQKKQNQLREFMKDVSNVTDFLYLVISKKEYNHEFEKESFQGYTGFVLISLQMLDFWPVSQTLFDKMDNRIIKIPYNNDEPLPINIMYGPGTVYNYNSFLRNYMRDTTGKRKITSHIVGRTRTTNHEFEYYTVLIDKKEMPKINKNIENNIWDVQRTNKNYLKQDVLDSVIWFNNLRKEYIK